MSPPLAAHVAASRADSGVACLTCSTWYATVVRRPGQRCGDLSRGQRPPWGCPGRVIPWPPPSDRRTRRRLVDARVCFACLDHVAPAAGVSCAALGILVHQGACAERLTAESRVHDRSPRGRLRPAREVLARLTGQRVLGVIA